MTARPTWDTYFLSLARTTSTRATCPRLAVGCVLVRDRVVCATGFNGSIVGAEHCIDVGCLMVDGHCVRCVHAEANALAQAARHGVSVDGATAYVTHRPCWGCLKLLVNAGVEHVYFEFDYGPEYPVGEKWTTLREYWVDNGAYRAFAVWHHRGDAP